MKQIQATHKNILTERHQIVVNGDVRAGAWLEIEQEPTATEVLPLDRDPRYERAGQYALRVVGNSINKKAQHGDYVIVAEWASLGIELKDGLLVVVQRERGGTVETTVKRLRSGREGWELWPESTDPAHQEKIALHDGDKDVEVRVVGLVIGYYRQEPQP